MGKVSQIAAGTPLVFAETGASTRLEKVTLSIGDHNESWLQALVFDHPHVLPMRDIEPGFGELVAVAREVPCGHGYIDNLYVTGAGDLVLVEAKLWRNAQSRREVVGQALDYVAALMKMGFEDFEEACRRGQGMAASTLHGLVAEHGDALEEAAFVDAVSRNLRQGHLVVAVLDDDIRSETEALAELLQSHAGAHLTFALIECALWRNPLTSDLLVRRIQPRPPIRGGGCEGSSNRASAMKRWANARQAMRTERSSLRPPPLAAVRTYGFFRPAGYGDRCIVSDHMAFDDRGLCQHAGLDYDLFAPAPYGLELVFSKVRMKPGKPVWLGQCRGRVILGLPGNPTSAMVTARLLLVPLLAGLGGRNAALKWERFPLAGALPPCGDRETFFRACRSRDGASPLDDQGSGAQLALVMADLLIRGRPHDPARAPGEIVEALAF